MTQHEAALLGLENILEFFQNLMAHLEAQLAPPPPPPTLLARLRRIVTGRSLAEGCRRTACRVVRHRVGRMVASLKADTLADLEANAEAMATPFVESDFSPEPEVLPEADALVAAFFADTRSGIARTLEAPCAPAMREGSDADARIAENATGGGDAPDEHEQVALIPDLSDAPIVGDAAETAAASAVLAEATAPRHAPDADRAARVDALSTLAATRLAGGKRVIRAVRASRDTATILPWRRVNWREARGPDVSRGLCLSRG